MYVNMTQIIQSVIIYPSPDTDIEYLRGNFHKK
jgi:hypothetical protein